MNPYAERILNQLRDSRERTLAYVEIYKGTLSKNVYAPHIDPVVGKRANLKALQDEIKALKHCDACIAALRDLPRLDDE